MAAGFEDTVNDVVGRELELVCCRANTDDGTSVVDPPVTSNEDSVGKALLGVGLRPISTTVADDWIPVETFSSKDVRVTADDVTLGDSELLVLVLSEADDVIVW